MYQPGCEKVQIKKMGGAWEMLKRITIMSVCLGVVMTVYPSGGMAMSRLSEGELNVLVGACGSQRCVYIGLCGVIIETAQCYTRLPCSGECKACVGTREYWSCQGTAVPWCDEWTFDCGNSAYAECHLTEDEGHIICYCVESGTVYDPPVSCGNSHDCDSP
jgi:hypothetical protein